MNDVAYDKSYKIMYQVVLVFNIFYYFHLIQQNIGVYELLPMPIDTPEGLALRLPFVLCISNLFLLLNCLLIKHWFTVLLYVTVLLLEAILWLGFNYFVMIGYTVGQSVWGGVVLLFYWMYWKNEPVSKAEPLEEPKS